jgi:hypothetical protein
MLTKFFKLTAVLVFLLAVGASSALADGITATLNQCHLTTGCTFPSAGTVTLTQVGTSVDGTVSLNTGFDFVKTGAGDSQAFELVGTPPGSPVHASQFTITSPTTPVLTVGQGSFTGAASGAFQFGISCPSCSGGASDEFFGPIHFTVSDATLAQLAVQNDHGQFFAADIITPTMNTGVVSANSVTATTVPEPSTLVLMLSGFALVAAGILGKKLVT